MLDNIFKITPILEESPCLAERVSDLTRIKLGDLLEIEEKSHRIFDIRVTDYKDLSNPKYEIIVLARDKEMISKRTYIDTDVVSLSLGLLYYLPGSMPIKKNHFRTLTKEDKEYKIFDRFLKQYESQKDINNDSNKKLNIFTKLFGRVVAA